MKFLHAILVSSAALLPAAAQTTNTAPIAGWCRSISLGLGGAMIPGGPATNAFSTYDGVANSLLTDSRYSIVSDELRPRVGVPGVYEADYGFFRVFGFVEVGSMVLVLPTTDADTNGVPDIVQVNQPGHTAIIGDGHQDTPLGLDFRPVTGQFDRNEGSDVGSYSMAWNNPFTGDYMLSGELRVLHLEGQVAYARWVSNVMRFQFTLHSQSGSSLVLTGSTVYTVRNANEVQLPRFKLRSGSRQYVVLPATLARSGQRYAGNIQFVDLLLETSWRDYIDWAIEITDTTDANTNGIPDLSDPLAVPDFTPPKVAISTPAANARLTNESVVVQGTASDDRAVTQVLYSLNGAPFTLAVGTNLWFATVTLQPGTNTFAVMAMDAATNASAVVTRRFVRYLLSPLIVEVVGAGTVTPDLNGHLLEIGRRYTLTAVPAASNLFAFWSGGTSSALAKLTFTMSSNLVLGANFVPNPFLPLKGAYTGLFAEPGNVLHETSGYFSAKLADRGAFSGSLRRGGRSHGFSGQFALDGKATNLIRLSAAHPLVLSLCLDLASGTEQITGAIADVERVAVLAANRTQPRSAANPAGRFPGRYTMSLAPQPGTVGPAGAGLAAVTANTNGSARFAGFLADGTPFASSGAISKEGFYPLYQPLYGGKGCIFSGLWLTNDPALPLLGLADWIKPTRPTDRIYPGGFTNRLEARGTSYTLSEVTNALASAVSATVQISGLPTPDTTSVMVWNRAARLTNSAGMSLALAPATGLWSGVYPEPVSGRRLPFKTTLQPALGGLLGAGFLIQSNISGAVNFILP